MAEASYSSDLYTRRVRPLVTGRVLDADYFADPQPRPDVPECANLVRAPRLGRLVGAPGVQISASDRSRQLG